MRFFFNEEEDDVWHICAEDWIVETKESLTKIKHSSQMMENELERVNIEVVYKRKVEVELMLVYVQLFIKLTKK